MANRIWTEEEDSIIRADRAARIPVPVTAAKLNRPVPATYLRARKIGTLVQPHTAWTEEQEDRLRTLVAHKPPLTDKEIAADLGRNVVSVRWKMAQLGLIGQRDLSKLMQHVAERHPRPRKAPNVRVEVRRTDRKAHDCKAKDRKRIEAGIRNAVREAEKTLVPVLKDLVRAAELGFRQADREADREKKAIDKRLAKVVAEHRRREVPKAPKAPRVSVRPIASRTVEPRLPAHPVAPSRPVVPAAVRAPARPAVVVLNEPAPVRLSAPAVPARTKRGITFACRTASRDDALALAKAATTAVERFMAERGVTRARADEETDLVTRLQRRGYVIVPKTDDAGRKRGWTIDGRHRIDNVEGLKAFAEARGHV